MSRHERSLCEIVIENWLADKDEVSGIEILEGAIGLNLADMEIHHTGLVDKAMINLGWLPKRKPSSSDRWVTVYHPPA